MKSYTSVLPILLLLVTPLTYANNGIQHRVTALEEYVYGIEIPEIPTIPDYSADLAQINQSIVNVQNGIDSQVNDLTGDFNSTINNLSNQFEQQAKQYEVRVLNAINEATAKVYGSIASSIALAGLTDDHLSIALGGDTSYTSIAVGMTAKFDYFNVKAAWAFNTNTKDLLGTVGVGINF